MQGGIEVINSQTPKEQVEEGERLNLAKCRGSMAER